MLVKSLPKRDESYWEQAQAREAARSVGTLRLEWFQVVTSRLGLRLASQYNLWTCLLILRTLLSRLGCVQIQLADMSPSGELVASQYRLLTGHPREERRYDRVTGA